MPMRRLHAQVNQNCEPSSCVTQCLALAAKHDHLQRLDWPISHSTVDVDNVRVMVLEKIRMPRMIQPSKR
jgi:hypothetical protein